MSNTTVPAQPSDLAVTPALAYPPNRVPVIEPTEGVPVSKASPSVVTIGRRSYSGFCRGSRSRWRQYILTGERGASYLTMRRVNHPEVMFLVHRDPRKLGIPSGFDSVLLTDSDGELRVVRR